MIRRKITRDDDTPAWVLISQIEHARVAGELARDWAGGLPESEVTLPTIFHHDDGWDRWEQQPTIDPAEDCPRSFTEMPNVVAHEIWRRSIDKVSEFGPLAQYMVAEHFMRLRRGGDETQQPGVQAFFDEYETRCEQWSEEWTTNKGATAGRASPGLCTDYLQLFDAFSLMLCCTPSGKPVALSLPGGGQLTLQISGIDVTVTPWPWENGEKDISATGRILPIQRFTSDEQLRESLRDAEEFTLTWRIRPAAGQ